MDKFEASLYNKKGELIKKALQIVDKLAKSEIVDYDGDDISSDDREYLENLVMKARELVDNTLWEL